MGAPRNTSRERPGLSGDTKDSGEHPWVPHSTNREHTGVSNGSNHSNEYPWVPHSTKSGHPGVSNDADHSNEHPWVPHSTNREHPGVSNGTNHSNEHPWVPHGTNPAGEQPGVVPTASPVSSEGGDVLLEDGLEAPGVDGLGGVGVPKGSDDIGEGCGDGWASARRLRKGLYQLGGGVGGLHPPSVSSCGLRGPGGCSCRKSFRRQKSLRGLVLLRHCSTAFIKHCGDSKGTR